MKRPIFTPQEKELLQKHIKFYMALDTGEREPTTPDQKHFVAVCRGSVHPSTPHERAYLKAKNLVKQDLLREQNERERAQRDRQERQRAAEVKRARERKRKQAEPSISIPQPRQEESEHVEEIPSHASLNPRAAAIRRKRQEELLKPGSTPVAIPDREEGVPADGWATDEAIRRLRRTYGH
jgi:uncharacterized protein YifE (UPF0438 family)